MKIVNYFILIIGVIGSLNWGLIGLFDVNIITFLFGSNSLVERLIYVLVGLSGMYMLSFFPKIAHEHHS